ncbi:helix-turn-helix domain-containing protein [soil metagenome]
MLGDRADELLQLVAENLVAVEFSYREGGPVAADAKIDVFGDIKHASGYSSVVVAERTAALARDDSRPTLVLGMQRFGTSIVVQHGREAVLRPGELMLWDSTAPFTNVDTGGIRDSQFHVPIDRLALPHDLITKLCAVPLNPGHPVGDLAYTYFRRLAARPDLFDSAADALGAPSIELVRALITTHLDATELGKDAMHATLQTRIMEYLRAHLHEPDLNAAQVAAEHHISVRQLYKVLAAGGIMLGDWVRAERLAGCRRDLADPAWRVSAIGSVARRWGFADPSSFARMFRAEYGVSPREWRDIARREWI